MKILQAAATGVAIVATGLTPQAPARAAQQTAETLHSVTQGGFRLTVKKREGSLGSCELGLQASAAGREFALTVNQNRHGRTMMVLGGAKTLLRTMRFAVPVQPEEIRPFTIKTIGPDTPAITRVALKTDVSTDAFYVGTGGLSPENRANLLTGAQGWEVFDKDGVLLHNFAPPQPALANALAAFETCNRSW
ncbi:hypothetical protein [Porphyrobacter sp. YT40]|uniref:hypothetical protein n=1 Tax=Porphyrobacter sp. YT40 TaxID=2547601 RepID=UPI0011434F0E|nr:hypothetical protein [Porphyrobacter sp. YT40]QDH33303.1 hypothetical protein E2E27_02515 [Porphyrobacter sp. YT40]